MKAWRLRWVSPFNIIVSSCSVVWEACCGTLLTCVMMITGVPSSILRDRLDPHWASVGSKQASHPWEHEVSNIHIPFHLSKEQVLHFDSTHAGSWLRDQMWLSFAGNNDPTSFLFAWVHSLHVRRLAQCRASCLFWGKCICLFWNNYYLLYCPVKSDILSFHFHIHLSDRSFACPSALRPTRSAIILSRAMAASCQARPSVRIVDGRGKLSKQLVRKLSSVDGRTFWSDCAQSTSNTSRPSQMNDSEHKSCVNFATGFATGLVEQS